MLAEVRRNTGKAAGITENDMARIRKALTRGPEKGRQAMAATMDKATRNISRAMQRGKLSVDTGMDQIVDLMNAKLRLFGFSGSITSLVPKSVKDIPELKQRGGDRQRLRRSGDRERRQLPDRPARRVVRAQSCCHGTDGFPAGRACTGCPRAG